LEKTKRNRIVLYAVAALLLILISYLAITLPSEDYRLIGNEKIDLNQGWTVEYGDVVLEDVNLPHDLGLEKDVPYTARLTLPEGLDNHIRLRLRSSMQDIIVYVDGQEIFRDMKATDGRFVVPDASLWHLFELPNDIGGKELKLQMQSPTKAFSGNLNEVYAGQGKDLILDVVVSNVFKIVLATIFIIFGAVTLVLSGLFRNLEDNRLTYLGGFAIFVAIWTFSEAKVLQLIVGNRFIIGGLSYIVIPLIATSFVMFLKESVLRKYRSIMVAFAAMFQINLVTNIYLQLSGIASFISSMQFTVVLVVLTLAASIFFMVLEWKGHDNHQAKRMLIYSSTSGSFLLMEVIVFLLGRYEFTGYLTGIGILLFIVQISYNTFRAIKIMIQNEKESEILKKLAYRDILTNMGNRAAFEEYIDGLRNSNATKPFRLAMMDINNLKYINDNYGHKEGDEAIKACSGAIGKYLQPYGECFRLGGDEFACVIFDLDDETFESQVKMMREELKERKSEHEYILDIAIGSDVYDFNRHNDIGDFIHQTDLKMYSNKKRIKERGYGTV